MYGTGSTAEVVREALLALSGIHLCFAVMDYVYSKFILVANPVCTPEIKIFTFVKC